MASRDPYHGHPIMLAMRDRGFETTYMSGDLVSGSGGGHVTVVMGGMPIGELTRSAESGEWEFQPGDGGGSFVTARPGPRTRPETHEPEPAAATSVAFLASCSAWTHEGSGRRNGVWHGPVRDTYEEAQADAASHEHAEAYVGQIALS
jgi:hypothetical protein